MKSRLLPAVLAALTLAAPAFAQQGDSGGSAPDASPRAQDGADRAPHAGAQAPAEAPAESPDGRLYIRLDKGGEVIFKPIGQAGGAKAPPAAGAPAARPAGKVKYRGYAKKGLLKYKKAAEEKRLMPDAVSQLAPAKAAKAKELAAEAEMNEDVRDTLKEKLQAAKAAGGDPAEKGKLEAAAQSADKVGKAIAWKMKHFEEKEAAGKKVFKEPSAPGAEPDSGGGEAAPQQAPAGQDGAPQR